jgi:xanthine dehydrogenase molybdopterin-binding subunit B
MATTTTKQETLVGKRIRRREDPRLITGTATYVEDIQMPGMLHAAIIRSPHAAANIRSIDIKAAASAPGVVAVFTGADTEKVGPVPCGASLPGLKVPHHHILATARVYFVGHPVAVVVARDKSPPSRIPKRRLLPERRPSIPNGRTTCRSRTCKRAAKSTRLLQKPTSW